jgi:hypothetical protein
MTTRRRATIHDLTTLRVHPDGSLAKSPTSTGGQRGRHSIRDRRGNWIADDAMGPSTVKRRRKTRIDEEGGTEEHGSDRRKVRGKPKDVRTARRRKFLGDFTFLDSIPRPQDQIQGGGRDGILPVPSSVCSPFILASMEHRTNRCVRIS